MFLFVTLSRKLLIYFVFYLLVIKAYKLIYILFVIHLIIVLVFFLLLQCSKCHRERTGKDWFLCIVLA